MRSFKESGLRSFNEYLDQEIKQDAQALAALKQQMVQERLREIAGVANVEHLQNIIGLQRRALCQGVGSAEILQAAEARLREVQG